MNRIAEPHNVTRLHLVNHVNPVDSCPDPQSSSLKSMPAATLWLRLIYTNLHLVWAALVLLKVNESTL